MTTAHKSLILKTLLVMLLVLTCNVLPVAASAASFSSLKILGQTIALPADGHYSYSTDGAAVTNNAAAKPGAYVWMLHNKGGIYTLTLKGWNYNGSSSTTVIETMGDITIELLGNTKFNSNEQYTALFCRGGDAIITGNGKLICEAGYGQSDIQVGEAGNEANLTIQSGTIQILDNAFHNAFTVWGKLTMTGGYMETFTAGSYHGVYALKGIELSGHAELIGKNIQGVGGNGIQSDGPVVVRDMAKLTGFAQLYVTQDTFPSQYGVSGSLKMDGGYLLAQGTLAALNNASARNALDLSGYTGYVVTASKNFDGSDPVTFRNTYVPSNDYQYLHVEPGPTPVPSPRTAPKTGDSANPAVWIVLLAVSVAAIPMVLRAVKRR